MFFSFQYGRTQSAWAPLVAWSATDAHTRTHTHTGADGHPSSSFSLSSAHLRFTHKEKQSFCWSQSNTVTGRHQGNCYSPEEERKPSTVFFFYFSHLLTVNNVAVCRILMVLEELFPITTIRGHCCCSVSPPFFTWLWKIVIVEREKAQLHKDTMRLKPGTHNDGRRCTSRCVSITATLFVEFCRFFVLFFRRFEILLSGELFVLVVALFGCETMATCLPGVSRCCFSSLSSSPSFAPLVQVPRPALPSSAPPAGFSQSLMVSVLTRPVGGFDGCCCCCCFLKELLLVCCFYNKQPKNSWVVC